MDVTEVYRQDLHRLLLDALDLLGIPWEWS